ncbi:glutathione transferase GST 23-like [Juglans microcarpa x Juglans regia]|uniref:glutathione transferase GST 23-like n=1 Tax=Juglans microcarpa x Juglans regia TaxID=2249226 RepID=UPI001B7E1648|nr:glutathione transferase GST 23-like [Juglans microcarpa x Juglans regia]
MVSQEVKLLGFWASPFSIRVEWALKLKGVDFEYIEEDIFNKSSRLLELNPVHKKVPVLVHDGKVMAESFILLEYIDETWKQDPLLLPQDAYERSKARFWARVAEEKLLEASFTAMVSHGENKEKALKSAIEVAEKIEEEMKGNEKKFLGGESIGYLDLAMGWIAHWLPIWEEVGSMQIVDPSQFPATTAWSKRFLDHPVIKQNLPPRDKMLVYFHERKKILGGSG